MILSVTSDLLFNLACLASIGSQWQYPQQPRSYMTIGWLQRFDNLSSFYAYSQAVIARCISGYADGSWHGSNMTVLRHFMRLRAREEAYQTALLEKRKVTAPDITPLHGTGSERARMAGSGDRRRPLSPPGGNRQHDNPLRAVCFTQNCIPPCLALSTPSAVTSILLIDMLADGGTPLELSSHLPNPPDALVTHP